ncbi:hypothetical protein [Streptomyces sp. NPDC045369]|uniref:hypothetical protein n=1 Tax=Streptomyces sp. NPDC045369 TaxID=3155732 RepID=UPI0033E3B0FF
MSTEADFADASRLPRTPPRVPAPPTEDPQTAVLRPVPPERPAEPGPGPMPPTAPATAPPRPATPAAAPPRPAAPAAPLASADPPPPVGIPPLPTHAPAPARTDAAPTPAPAPPRTDPAPTPPPVPAQAPADRSATPRDTAAFHLANSEAFWNGPGAAEAHPNTPPRPTQPPAGAAPPPTGTPLSGPPLPPAPACRARLSRRSALAAAGLVLGLGLVAGATAGTWLADDTGGSPAAEAVFAQGREVWHSAPVDTLFPRTLNGVGTGPGGADRTWIRAAVAPDSGCAGAFDPLLAKALAPVGCHRLVRATYVDVTRTNLVTVGAVATKADRTAMQDLRRRFAKEHLDTRTDLMPGPYAAKGTPAGDFGPAQRASWSIRVLDDLPVVVYAVSGFADGRTVDDPQPAAEATRAGATTAPAEAGLGHDAKAVSERIEQTFRKQAAKGTTEPQ